jgi:hypothetical protein
MTVDEELVAVGGVPIAWKIQSDGVHAGLSSCRNVSADHHPTPLRPSKNYNLPESGI